MAYLGLGYLNLNIEKIPSHIRFSVSFHQLIFAKCVDNNRFVRTNRDIFSDSDSIRECRFNQCISVQSMEHFQTLGNHSVAAVCRATTDWIFQ